ncbi:MAG: hypothetical protein SOX56_07500 [[Pasteurella] mairii]|nr:hypothetical protein [[Pasteurella] mairii]
MPNNRYDIWTLIWNWATTNIGIQPINSAIATIVMSLYLRRK